MFIKFLCDQLPFPFLAAFLYIQWVLLDSRLKGLNYTRDKTLTKCLWVRGMKVWNTTAQTNDSLIVYMWVHMLLCHRGVQFMLQINSSSWILYCSVFLLSFIYYHHTHSHKPLSPYKEILSCSSKPIHPLPALLLQPAASPPPSPTSFPLPSHPPGIKYPLTQRPLHFVLIRHLSVISPPVCSVWFSQNQLRGNPSSLVCTSSYCLYPEASALTARLWICVNSPVSARRK